ncbi:hypothetical protein GCM10027446_16750 [Angustibacter peucedani]
MAVTDQTLEIGDDVQVIAGAHRGHRATLVEVGGATSSRHVVRCQDGETVRLSKVHVQRHDDER